MSIKPRNCLECGTEFQPARAHGLYCSDKCRSVFGNRRKNRGADLYDLFCAMRSERGAAKDLGVWSAMCQLEMHWREEDCRSRPGLKSYVPPRVAILSLKEQGKLSMGEVLAKSHQVGRGS